MITCKHEHLSERAIAMFDDNCLGMQVKRCKDCGVIVKKREISSDWTKPRFNAV